MSPKFPIGVETIYKPFFIIIIINFFILLVSCAPANNILNTAKQNTNTTEQNTNNQEEVLDTETKSKSISTKESISNKIQTNENFNAEIQNNITIILSKKDNAKTVIQFINIIELAVYEKKLQNIFFDIEFYENKNQLETIIKNTKLLGKIFIGPLKTADTELLKNYCDSGALFFSFSSNKDLANDCVYLVNFFPENEMRTIFKHFPKNSKIALLYPENNYGYSINKIIDDIANKSDSVIVNRSSYNENLSNAAEAIKELGKYELRKYELNRQKKILANKRDDESKRRLIKLERFKTTKDLDFTHVIIADYGLRLLQVAPLLPYYDIDPNIVKFVGTGAWDDEVFYDEPSLGGAIYPGIDFVNRKKLVDDYYSLYKEKILRTSTLPYDLVGLLFFVIDNKYTVNSLYKLLDQSNIKFSGVDGSFYFLNNAIERDLEILKIQNGKATNILK